MTDAELQAIRERYDAAVMEQYAPPGVRESISLAGNDEAIKESIVDVPRLLEAVDAAETLKGSYHTMALGLSAYIVDCAWPVRKKMDEELIAAETEIARLRTALKTIQDYAGDNPAELHVAQELLDDIRKVAGRALKPEGEADDRD